MIVKADGGSSGLFERDCPGSWIDFVDDSVSKSRRRICPQKCPQNSRSESRRSGRWLFEPLLRRPVFAAV
jgi:hypothetical protein